MGKQYAERDIVEQGDHYVRHVSAMTREDLHTKSDIAAELAHRDIRIAELEAEVKRLTISLATAKACVSQQHKDIAKLRDIIARAKGATTDYRVRDILDEDGAALEDSDELLGR